MRIAEYILPSPIDDHGNYLNRALFSCVLKHTTVVKLPRTGALLPPAFLEPSQKKLFEMSNRERHRIYISGLVWAELRKNAVLQPGYDASQIIEFVLESWLASGGVGEVLSRAQTRTKYDLPGRRSVFLRPGLWKDVSARAEAGDYSVSMLIEKLLRRYLDLESQR